ncbi:MAG TPA: nickel-type superoxide dismutase maturation protease [Acidimicrobiales bacterium]|nr:nickel-type superoxide dismutase maturation protease [Acidimicrobiales bacterium]
MILAVPPGRDGHVARWIVLAGLAAALVAAVAVLRPRRVVVAGRSMEPDLRDGDRLVVVRARRLAPGDVVAVRDPRDPRRLLVKRVTSMVGDDVMVHGDNPAASTDSRAFGPVSRRAVVGRVVRRYEGLATGAR